MYRIRIITILTLIMTIFAFTSCMDIDEPESSSARIPYNVMPSSSKVNSSKQESKVSSGDSSIMQQSGDISSILQLSGITSTQQSSKIVSTQQSSKITSTQQSSKIVSTQQSSKIVSTQQSSKIVSKQQSSKAVSTQQSSKTVSMQGVSSKYSGYVNHVYNSKDQEFIDEVIRLTNLERAKESLPALKKGDDYLNGAAYLRVTEIVKKFSHTRPDGSEWNTAFEQCGVFANNDVVRSGENLAAGQTTPQNVVEDWMNSPGHKANIMNVNFTHISVGYIYESNSVYKHYWTQAFLQMR